MWLEGQGLQDCQRKIWQSPNEDSSNSQREREILERCPPLRLLLFVFWTGWSQSFVFPPRMKKRQKQEYTPQLLFRSSLFLYLLSFPLIVFVKRAWYMVGTKGGGVLDTEQWRWEKKGKTELKIQGKAQEEMSAGQLCGQWTGQHWAPRTHSRTPKPGAGSSSHPNISPKSHDIIFVQIAKCICLIWRRKKSSNCIMYLFKL